MNASTANWFTLDPDRSYIHVQKEQWSWNKITGGIQLKYHRPGSPLPQFSNIFLLSDLGGGADGRVWLASTGKGDVVVLKFSQDESSLETEAKIWKEVWKCDVQVKRLNKRYALVMPWMKPCNDKEFKNEEISLAIEEATINYNTRKP